MVPLLTWSTTLLPFLGASSYSTPFLVPKLRSDAPIGDRVAEIEDWARVVNSCHTVSVDVAARRLASSVSQRLDSGDALVDAVMVWENLVGTSSEVTFRVTAALTKLLEQEAAKRRAFRKSLAQIYDIRSRLVHGVAVDQSELSEAAKEAIVVAVRALRACYRRGRDWLSLSSTERGDALLLNT